jgi:hypothetical protein
MELGYRVSNEWNGFGASYYCGGCLDTSTGVEDFEASDGSQACIYCGKALGTWDQVNAPASDVEIMDHALTLAFPVGYRFEVQDWTGGACASFLTVRDARAYINEWDSDSRDRMMILPYHGDGRKIMREEVKAAYDRNLTRHARNSGCRSVHSYLGNDAACILDNGHTGQHEDICGVHWGRNSAPSDYLGTVETRWGAYDV